MQRQPLLRHSKLVRYLTVTYLGLVVYTSLHPFSEWRAPAGAVRNFLTAPWPAYFTWADLLLNVVAYVPAGALLALVLLPFMRAGAAALTAGLLGIALSLMIEILQVFLPGRIPSNTDLLCNAIGSVLGAGTAVVLAGRGLLSGRLYHLRQSQFQSGATADICFVLLALWLATQFNTEIRLFGNGDVRQLLPAVLEVRYSPDVYVLLEAAITGLSFCGVALMLTAISRSLAATIVSVLALLASAVALKSLAASVLFESGNAMLWITSGATWGIFIGGVLWLSLIVVPRPLQITSATTFTALAMALVNAAPDNPYLDASLRAWQHGHYASLNDLTSVISSVWPFAAIAFLSYLAYRLR